MEQRSPRRQTPVAVLAIGGLVVSAVAGIFLIDPPNGKLPGIALGSEAILVVERIAALFAAWLFALVVVGRALIGQLPSEVSGRGIRYAEADTAQTAIAVSRRTLGGFEDEMDVLHTAIFDLQEVQAKQAELLRRYAMKGVHGGD